MFYTPGRAAAFRLALSQLLKFQTFKFLKFLKFQTDRSTIQEKISHHPELTSFAEKLATWSSQAFSASELVFLLKHFLFSLVLW